MNLAKNMMKKRRRCPSASMTHPVVSSWPASVLSLLLTQVKKPVMQYLIY